MIRLAWRVILKETDTDLSRRKDRRIPALDETYERSLFLGHSARVSQGRVQRLLLFFLDFLNKNKGTTYTFYYGLGFLDYYYLGFKSDLFFESLCSSYI